MEYKLIFWGKVTSGKKRGHSLGFPTANINLHKNIPEGIYISLAIVNKHPHPALTFIGSSKTFKENDVKAETHFLKFKKNIYGKWISVRLLKKIRENQNFKSTQDLVKQMEKDKQNAQKFFKTNKYV
ncbi:MAG: riboflavin kinase [Candidatus Magasanikbacteria bacterium]|nr:riboflavin kinase [Candidatus Magasanikbacteria bacterium]